MAFIPNDKLIYTIKIDVMENCSSLSILSEDGVEITYHSILGALETQKYSLMTQQMGVNREFLNSKKKPKKAHN